MFSKLKIFFRDREIKKLITDKESYEITFLQHQTERQPQQITDVSELLRTFRNPLFKIGMVFNTRTRIAYSFKPGPNNECMQVAKLDYDILEPELKEVI